MRHASWLGLAAAATLSLVAAYKLGQQRAAAAQAAAAQAAAAQAAAENDDEHDDEHVDDENDDENDDDAFFQPPPRPQRDNLARLAASVVSATLTLTYPNNQRTNHTVIVEQFLHYYSAIYGTHDAVARAYYLYATAVTTAADNNQPYQHRHPNSIRDGTRRPFEPEPVPPVYQEQAPGDNQQHQ